MAVFQSGKRRVWPLLGTFAALTVLYGLRTAEFRPEFGGLDGWLMLRVVAITFTAGYLGGRIAARVRTANA